MIPDKFEDDTDIPHSYINGLPVVIQWSDQWFDECEDEWRAVDASQVGKWIDEAFPQHVIVYGYLWRFSDAYHPTVFKSKYGRDKPKELVPRPDESRYWARRLIKGEDL